MNLRFTLSYPFGSCAPTLTDGKHIGSLFLSLCLSSFNHVSVAKEKLCKLIYVCFLLRFLVRGASGGILLGDTVQRKAAVTENG